MANNYMWLVNKRLGARVLLAKGWARGQWVYYAKGDMRSAFDKDEYPFTDWELEFERVEVPTQEEQAEDVTDVWALSGGA